MKKLYTLMAALLLIVTSYAQSPEMMSYQAVVRDGSDALVKNTQVKMQISILQGSSAVYVETQTPTTNANGLLSIEIGAGIVVSGAMNTIDWSVDVYFIKTEVDIDDNGSYDITGTSQLLSVPYALYAKTSGNGEGPAGPAGVNPIFLLPSQFGALYSTKNVNGYGQSVITLPPGATNYTSANVPKPAGWENAISFDYTVYWSAVSDATNTWTLEWGVDAYAMGTQVQPNVSTESAIAPTGDLGTLQVTTQSGVNPFVGNLATADILSVIIGRWNCCGNDNTGDIYVYGVRITPNF